MVLTLTQARRILSTYKRAWEKQDTELILTIFAPKAVYHEYLHKRPLKGHKAIKAYWQSKVVIEQRNITCKTKNIYVAGNVMIAEWEAKFYSRVTKKKYHLKQIAVFETQKNKVISYREYWHARKS